MQGKIIKGIAGFYYVYAEETDTIYECKAKGIFRNRRVKPLVGDLVAIEVLDEEQAKGNITEILPRKNELIRPASANVDQAMVIFAAANPEPNFHLLDRFLVMMDYQNVPTVICFNKEDLIGADEKERLREIYAGADCQIVFTSTYEKTGIDINPGAVIDEYFCIDHGTGIVIGETATIGHHVKLYQGVTIGAKSFDLDENGNPLKCGKRHPDIGDYVVIYANATILGGNTVVGSHSIIGGNTWLLHSVEEGSKIYYR